MTATRKIWGVAGWKNTGKTGLMERLVAEFTARGISVATIKHAHHSFDVDQKGKDSYRHRAAGAKEVVLASDRRWVLMAELRGSTPPTLDELIERLSPVDLILVEGYKAEPHPKIETHRVVTGQGLISSKDPSFRAVASDSVPESDLPVFDLDDTATIADFIAAELGL